MKTAPKHVARDGERVERWQAPAMSSLPSTRSEAAAELGTDRLLTADRLATIEAEARHEGHRAGFEEGRRAGLEAGREEGRARMEQDAARLAALLDSIMPQLNVLDDDLVAQVGELVLAVARQFVRRELRTEPGEVVRVVREALAALPASDASVRLHLHPEDAALVRSALPDAYERPLQIVEDMTVSQGGTRLETKSSVVDATVEARMGTIAARLLGDERGASSAAEPPDEHA